jgi:hypothetical protein
MTIDWNDPAARNRLIECVGPDEYNRLHTEQMARGPVATVNGHAIHKVQSRSASCIRSAGPAPRSAHSDVIEISERFHGPWVKHVKAMVLNYKCAAKVYNHSKRTKEKRAVLDGVAAELQRIIGEPMQQGEAAMRIAA